MQMLSSMVDELKLQIVWDILQKNLKSLRESLKKFV